MDPDDERTSDEGTGKGKRPYCVCGLSAEMPYCDGSHSGRHRPRRVANAAHDLGMVFCSCGKSSKAPFCEPSTEGCAHAEQGDS